MSLEPGHYKTRERPRGPWVPVRVWWVRGEFVRVREGKLMSHMVLKCRWWPDEAEDIDPYEEVGAFERWNFFEEIDADEFELMRATKEL